jgi:hypothetical protein
MRWAIDSLIFAKKAKAVKVNISVIFFIIILFLM